MRAAAIKAIASVNPVIFGSLVKSKNQCEEPKNRYSDKQVKGATEETTRQFKSVCQDIPLIKLRYTQCLYIVIILLFDIISIN